MFYTDPAKMGVADRIHFTVIKCPNANCSEVFFKDSECEKHCVLKHKVDWIGCRVKGCDKLFNNRSSARAHEKTCRYIANPKLSGRVYCPETNCPASVSGFINNSGLNRHMRNSHKKFPTTKSSDVMIKDKFGRFVNKKSNN